jgi:hypothetical protein
LLTRHFDLIREKEQQDMDALYQRIGSIIERSHEQFTPEPTSSYIYNPSPLLSSSNHCQCVPRPI